ncbi:MAG: SDR family oxidoreductase, partial [Emcibacteraceae bacterium]|nr:SDR family oxidoreductase [Emcibacteraceae bacterium]
YAASKAGMDGFTRSLSRELGRRKVTVNSIAPGYMETEISAGLSSSQLQQIIKRTPLGQLVDVEDIANMTDYLLSDKARNITGQIIVIDGGLTA